MNSGKDNETSMSQSFIIPTVPRARSARQAKKWIDETENAIIIDVREEEEFITGHIEGAILFPVDTISEETASDLLPDKKAPLLIYCRSGARSAMACQILSELGYASLRDLGGLAGWPYKLV